MKEKAITGQIRKFTSRTESTGLGQTMTNITIWSFIIERYDKNENLLSPIAAEIRGKTLIGILSEGDNIEIINAKIKEGILNIKSLRNLTTNSIVKSIQSENSCFSSILGFIFFLVVIIIFVMIVKSIASNGH